MRFIAVIVFVDEEHFAVVAEVEERLTDCGGRAKPVIEEECSANNSDAESKHEAEGRPEADGMPEAEGMPKAVVTEGNCIGTEAAMFGTDVLAVTGRLAVTTLVEEEIVAATAEVTTT